MRKLAAFVAEEQPGILAICEIEPGDALSLATRFDMQWAYRGRQALFWRSVFSAEDVAGNYLPAMQLFGRRGFVSVDGLLGGVPCTLAATQFARERRTRVAELRFARTQMRSARRAAVLFAHLRERRIAFGDLGFSDVTPAGGGDERVYVRGLEQVEIRVSSATV